MRLDALKAKIERHYAAKLAKRAGAEVDQELPMVRLSPSQTAEELGIPPVLPRPFLREAVRGIVP